MFDYQGIIPEEKNYLYVDWCTGTQCNYNCSYCCQSSRDKKQEFILNPGKIDKTLDVLYSLKRPIEISLAGGETTLFPHLRYLLEKTTDHVMTERVTVLTNGHKPLSYFDELVSGLDLNNLFIYWSVHPEYTGNIRKFQTKVRELSEMVNLQLAIMAKMDSPRLKKIIVAVDQISTNSNRIYSKLVLVRKGQFLDDISYYSQDEIDFVLNKNREWKEHFPPPNKPQFLRKENSLSRDHNYLLVNGYTNFRGMYCLHGTTCLWIRDDGYCSGSICPQAKISRYSIYDGINPFLLKEFSEPIRCSQKMCSCKDNLLIPKLKKL